MILSNALLYRSPPSSYRFNRLSSLLFLKVPVSIKMEKANGEKQIVSGEGSQNSEIFQMPKKHCTVKNAQISFSSFDSILNAIKTFFSIFNTSDCCFTLPESLVFIPWVKVFFLFFKVNPGETRQAKSIKNIRF